MGDNRKKASFKEKLGMVLSCVTVAVIAVVGLVACYCMIQKLEEQRTAKLVSAYLDAERLYGSGQPSSGQQAPCACAHVVVCGCTVHQSGCAMYQGCMNGCSQPQCPYQPSAGGTTPDEGPVRGDDAADGQDSTPAGSPPGDGSGSVQAGSGTGIGQEGPADGQDQAGDAGCLTRMPDGTLVYVIERGDTLSRISRKVGHSVDELASYNGIQNVNLIYAGSVLRIPEE